eukprot:3718238-Amphidinium_carterae.2
MPEFRAVSLAAQDGELEGADASIDSVQPPILAGVPTRTSTFAELPFRLPSSWNIEDLYPFDLLLPRAVPAAVHEQQRTEFTSESLSIPLRLATINVRSMNDAGKIKFVADRAMQRKLDILFVQETRLPDTITSMTVDGYNLIASPAASSAGAHGGLAVLIKVDPHFSIEAHKCTSPRVLVVWVTIATKRCRLVCGHAPIAEAPLADHAAFAVSMREALADPKAGELLFIGVDLNARLAGLDTDFSC